MIVKCEQCLTRFRLDDAKVRDEGVRVRCSKCKHIFLVAKEQPEQTEESDFDALLSGLVASSQPPESPTIPDPQFVGQSDFSVKPSTPIDTVMERDSSETLPEFSMQEPGALDSKHEVRAVADDEEDWFARNEASGYFEPESSPMFSAADSETKQESRDSGEPESIEVERITDISSAQQGWEDNASTGGLTASEEVIEVVQESSTSETWNVDSVGKADSASDAEVAWNFNIPAEQPIEEQEALVPDSGLQSHMLVESFDTQGVSEKELSPVTPDQDGQKPIDTASCLTGDDLPPLSIASRRKGASFFPVAVATIAVLMIIALAGVGFYMLNEGPTAFRKLGLESVAKWAGLESGEEGSMAIRNSASEFIKSRESGEIFVIKGEVVNGFRKPRASIQVKATLYSAKGVAIASRTAYCGNVLTKEQLTTLPFVKLEAAMNNQFGDSLANLGVLPGKAIPFVVVFAGVPGDASEFGLEVVGSTVASQ
jgi:predicted Zn finger-like uncharacterized protein